MVLKDVLMVTVVLDERSPGSCLGALRLSISFAGKLDLDTVFELGDFVLCCLFRSAFSSSHLLLAF